MQEKQYTEFDRQAIRDYVQAHGGPMAMRSMQGVAVPSNPQTDASRWERVAKTFEDRVLNPTEPLDLWEVDAICCEELGVHPAEVYGELYWTATAPPSPEYRAQAVRNAVEARLALGQAVHVVAAEVGVSRTRVARIKAENVSAA